MAEKSKEKNAKTLGSLIFYSRGTFNNPYLNNKHRTETQVDNNLSDLKEISQQLTYIGPGVPIGEGGQSSGLLKKRAKLSP
jgi:hypothetical protein